MGLEVSWAARIEVSRTDLVGLSVTLLPIMALALAAGWGLYDGVISRLRSERVTHAYALVGAGCILALHPLLALILGVDVFAATRSLGGLLAQGIAGAAGGWCCGYIRSPSSK
jgi:drug/metabolite transporter (DMT)-like permease